MNMNNEDENIEDEEKEKN